MQDVLLFHHILESSRSQLMLLEQVSETTGFQARTTDCFSQSLTQDKVIVDSSTKDWIHLRRERDLPVRLQDDLARHQLTDE